MRNNWKNKLKINNVHRKYVRHIFNKFAKQVDLLIRGYEGFHYITYMYRSKLNKYC